MRDSGQTEALERKFLSIWRPLVAGHSTVVLAVSGGGDSMALLTLALRVNDARDLHLRLIPAHVDHGLRPESGEEAAQLGRYVRERFGLDLVLRSVTVPTEGQGGLEMAARAARLRILDRVRRAYGEDTPVALAHQADDQAETVLMRILVGTGIPGLAGIRPQAGAFLHPLLSWGRVELREYLTVRGVGWIEDPSNQDRSILRNRIRLDLLPLLKAQYNPRVERKLGELGEQAAEWKALVESAVDRFVQDFGVQVQAQPILLPAAFGGLSRPQQALLLQKIAARHQLRLTSQHLRAALAGRAVWPHGWEVRKTSAGQWEIGCGLTVAPAEDFSALAPVWLRPGWIALPWGGRIGAERVDEMPKAKARLNRRLSWVQSADLSAWRVRTWRAGDRIRLLGLNGTKKLQDVFVDQKISIADKHRWPVVVDEAGVIVAVIGLALAEGARKGGAGWLLHYDPPAR